MTESKVKFYPGADIVVGGFSFDYDKVNSFSHVSGNEGYISAGIRFRAGILYEVSENLNIHFEANRTYNLLETVQIWSSNDIGITLQYSFNR